MSTLNFKHLRYFWVTAKAGSIVRAGQLLHVTPQTISGQIALFEQLQGCALFERAGRGLQLTEAGRTVFDYANQIFTLGDELDGVLRNPAAARPQQFRVGVEDAVPKVVAYRLLEPALRLGEPLRLACSEGPFADLLADLSVHRLDLVISDGPITGGLHVKAFNHLLGACGVTFFAAPKLAQTLKGKFPHCLHEAPMLMPGEDATMRAELLRWFDEIAVRPKVVGDFSDSALLKAFGRAGEGVFAAPSAIAAQIKREYTVIELGQTTAITETYYAISVERRLTHPAVIAITSAARQELFRARPARRPAASAASRQKP